MAHTAMQISERSFTDKEFKFYINRDGGLKGYMNFLRADNRMHNEYLGACLDYVRAGAMNACGWDTGVSGVMDFILHWINLNQGNLIWSDKPLPVKLKLPYRNFDKCPRDEKHKGTIQDGTGRIRCAHIKTEFARPSLIESYGPYLDELAQAEIFQIYEKEPFDPTYTDDWDEEIKPEQEWAIYKKQLQIQKDEKKIARIIKPCYAILKEPNFIMPLETMIDRLNIQPRKATVYCNDDMFSDCKRLNELSEKQRTLFSMGHCMGHIEENPSVVMPFCGWTLAWYVQKWHEQVKDGKAPVYRKSGEIDTFKKYKDFRVFSSED